MDCHFHVVAFTQSSAWAVGEGGVTYRLDQRGWQSIASGQEKTLRALAATTPANAIAVGDEGTVLRYDGGWKAVATGVTTALRAIIVEPALWIAGDHGTLLTGTSAALHPVDLRTECDLVSVFRKGSEIWVLGSAPAGGGALWRLSGDGTIQQHWGGC